MILSGRQQLVTFVFVTTVFTVTKLVIFLVTVAVTKLLSYKSNGICD